MVKKVPSGEKPLYEFLKKIIENKQENHDYTLKCEDREGQLYYVLKASPRKKDYSQGFYEQFVADFLHDLQTTKDKQIARYDFTDVFIDVPVHTNIFFLKPELDTFKRYCDIFIEDSHNNRKIASEMLVWYLSRLKMRQKKQTDPDADKYSPLPSDMDVDASGKPLPLNDYFEYLFTMGNVYGSENNSHHINYQKSALLDLDFFKKSMLEAGYTEERAKELIFSHLEASSGLESFDDENYITLANKILDTNLEKERFMKIVTGRDFVFNAQSVQEPRAVSAINFDSLSAMYRYDFAQSVHFENYMALIVSLANECKDALQLSGVYQVKDGKDVIVFARSLNHEPPDTELLNNVINEALNFYRNNLKNYENQLSENDPKEGYLGFEMSKLILLKKLDTLPENGHEENDSRMSRLKI
jgi:hypothetical protein